MMKHAQTIVITGASSGLGAALALHYARSGTILYLHGRNVERLAAVAKSCETLGAKTGAFNCDVTDAGAMQQWLETIDNATPIDLVIANAGISAGIGGGGESAKQTRDIFRINIDGVVNSVMPLIPRMAARKNGQIALISSLAGVRGLPSSPAYSGSKGWVRVYGEGLRGWLKRENIAVTVICPGFIKTPMTDVNQYPMPLMMSADKAARIIARAIEARRKFIAFPLALYLPLKLLSFLPACISDLLFSSLPDKPSVEN